MSDYAKATGAPRAITLRGQEYRVSKLRPRDIGELEAWFREATPNPKAEARRYMEGLPDAVAMHIWSSACEEAKAWPPRFESEEGVGLLMTPEGQARSLHICLRRGFPEGAFTLEMARDLSEGLEIEEIEAIWKLASPGDPDDPLSRSPATTTGKARPRAG